MLLDDLHVEWNTYLKALATGAINHQSSNNLIINAS